MDKLKVPMSGLTPRTCLTLPAGRSGAAGPAADPQFIDGLSRSVGTDRPRICFTGTEDKAQAYFEALHWTGGVPVVLPTEERLAALLKGTSHWPAEVVGIMAPGMRQAIVEKLPFLLSWQAAPRSRCLWRWP